MGGKNIRQNGKTESLRRRIADLRFEISKLKTEDLLRRRLRRTGEEEVFMNETRARTGMIAHFEKEVRDEISEMIWDGKSYRKIVAAMAEKGIQLNKGVLTTWRRGGYQDW